MDVNWILNPIVKIVYFPSESFVEVTVSENTLEKKEAILFMGGLGDISSQLTHHQFYAWCLPIVCFVKTL
jgi:hypothetical protein